MTPAEIAKKHSERYSKNIEDLDSAFLAALRECAEECAMLCKYGLSAYQCAAAIRRYGELFIDQ